MNEKTPPWAKLSGSIEMATVGLRNLTRQLMLAQGASEAQVDAHLAAVDERTRLERLAVRRAEENHARRARPGGLAPWFDQWPTWREDRVQEERQRLGLTS